jgi:DNA invertase Pin-like site-specific DNA recombinase
MGKSFIAYYRVSTDKQDEECTTQRIAVEAYLKREGGKLIGEERDVETGKRSDRPGLQRALVLCRKRKATLLIAKLDRLSRNLHFITGLIESKVDFVAADMPFATKLEIHVRAMFAEHERDMIAKRTSEALQARKATGKPWVSKKGRLVERLGSPDPSKGSAEGVVVNKAKALRACYRPSRQSKHAASPR